MGFMGASIEDDPEAEKEGVTTMGTFVDTGEGIKVNKDISKIQNFFN